MRYVKSQKTYKASNVSVTVDHEQKHYVAYSYGWWKFVTVYNGKVIFNNYRYSSSTQRHQSKALAILRADGVRIDHFVESRSSLTCDWRQDAISLLEYRIFELNDQLSKKGTHKAKNVERLAEIKRLRVKIAEIKSI